MSFECAVGLVGKNGAGKSFACQILSQLGFQVCSLSDYVREAAKAAGKTLDRLSLIETANQLKTEYGLDVLAQKSIQKTNTLGVQKVAFDSIRHPMEVALLKENGVIMIGIDAPIELRYKRVQARQNGTDLTDFETFKAHEEMESSGESHGQNLNAVFKKCDYILENADSPDAFQIQLTNLVTQLLSEEVSR